VYLWSILTWCRDLACYYSSCSISVAVLMCDYMVVSRRDYSRWRVLIVHVLNDVDYLVWEFYYTLPNKTNNVHLPCMQAYSLCAFSSDAPFCISTYAPASYRIANRESSRRTRRARRAARGAAIGGARGRRGGRWGASRVPRSPPEFLRERQAPEHFSLGLQIFN
jgi:hypothetical protein